MRDHGPHSVECATATGGDCHCDCHGTMHGITHLPHPGGKHGPDVTITPVKGAGGHVTHYTVAAKASGLPPGGGSREERAAAHAAAVTVVATSQRRRALPPPVADRARKIRESLPKDRAGWDATIPRHTSERDHLLERAADYDQRAQTFRDRRQQTVDAITASMKTSGASDKEIKKEVTGKKSHQYLDLKNADEGIAYWEGEAAKLREQAATAKTDAELNYPLDASRQFKMPTAEMNGHLDAILDVGNQALEAIRDVFRGDDEHKRLRDRIALRRDVKARRRALDADTTLPEVEKTRAVFDNYRRLPDGEGNLDADMRDLRRRESEIIREMLAEHRKFGGVPHWRADALYDDQAARRISGHPDDGKVTGARPDWRERLNRAEDHYPADWLRHSTAQPLTVVSSERAFYSKEQNAIALSTVSRDGAAYDGAFADETDEVTVHELGHRMEQTVPGLTHLEFAFVRRRSTGPDGTVEPVRKLRDITGNPAYMDYERGFADQWADPYAGKTYESRDQHPAGQSWEVFQVGTQDLYGRSSTNFDRGDELQAFVLGALLTLG